MDILKWRNWTNKFLLAISKISWNVQLDWKNNILLEVHKTIWKQENWLEEGYVIRDLKM